MSEKPIIFNTEMVKAILDGRKTQTRRLMKIQPPTDDYKISRMLESTSRANKKNEGKLCWFKESTLEMMGEYFEAPYQVGDRLWVRETILQGCHSSTLPSGDIDEWFGHEVEYVADGVKPYFRNPERCYPLWMAKRPSIHMPKWAARIWLEVTAVRVERVQDISDADAQAEGIRFDGTYWLGGIHPIKGTLQCWPTAKEAFEHLWNSIYKNWHANPFVWVIEFKRVDRSVKP